MDARLVVIKLLFVCTQMPQIIHQCQFDNEMEATCLSRSLFALATGYGPVNP